MMTGPGGLGKLVAVLLCIGVGAPALSSERLGSYRSYPEAGYVGASAFNTLAGVQVEVANPVGSVFVLGGSHLGVGSVDQWEKGGRFGFVAGFRFHGGHGLESGWHGTLFAGALDVETRREDGERTAYQRLGWGGGLGYQVVSGRLRAGFMLGVAQLETVRTRDGSRLDNEFIPVGEVGAALRF